MEKASQEAVTETKAPAITDENISQADYERLRSGEEAEVTDSAPEEKSSSKTVDESDTSKLEAKVNDADDESEVDDSDEAFDAVKAKKKSGTQRRIEKLVKQRAEVERERDFLREQLMRAQGKPEIQKPEVKASPEGAPHPDAFESYDEYVRASVKYEAREMLKADKAEAAMHQVQTQVNEKMRTHNEKMDSYKQSHSDFDELVSDFITDHPSFDLSDALKFSIAESESGPQLLHELFKNPEEFLRLNALSDMNVARAVGRLEAKFAGVAETKNTETKTKTTKAPPPARPVSASSANGKKSVYDDDLSQSDYERMRSEQEKKRRAI